MVEDKKEEENLFPIFVCVEVGGDFAFGLLATLHFMGFLMGEYEKE